MMGTASWRRHVCVSPFVPSSHSPFSFLTLSPLTTADTVSLSFVLYSFTIMVVYSILDMTSGDTLLAIMVGLLGAFLLHVASKLIVFSVPFHVRDPALRVSLSHSCIPEP